ncbi:hypothetical protein O3M35_001821 [Rhynocoris fuscipes]|uniref:Nucleoporin Nup43 n=1 Tax=Rhynocoris fuscipes TaxID=488301 RepID=A0AAW1CQA0_9HEMI
MSISNLSYFKEQVYNRIDRNYVSMKVSRVRWKPEDNNASPEYIVSGSYSEKVNSIDLWYYPSERDDDDEMFMNLPLNSINIKQGDITGLLFHEKNKFMYSCSQGTVGIIKIINNKMELLNEWEVCDEAAGFDIDLSSKEICVFGDTVVFFGIETDSNRGIINTDDVKCLSFLRQEEIVIGNLRGQLFVYDLRSYLKPSMAFAYNPESSVGVTCIKPYPLQKHILVASGLDGNITTWDLRKSTSPTDLYSGHDSPISHFQFSDRRPNNMFTTCYSGEMWHWTNFDSMLNGKQPDVQVLLERKKYPTNHCDIYNEHLVASTDNDSLVVVSPIKLL